MLTVQPPCSQGIGQGLDKVQQARLNSRSHIVHMAWRSRPRLRREIDQQASYVVHVDEISRLFPPGVQCRGHAVAHARDKDGDHAGVGPVVPLTWALDVEKTQGQRLPSFVTTPVNGLFVGPLAVGVRRLPHADRALDVGQPLNVAVNGGG